MSDALSSAIRASVKTRGCVPVLMAAFSAGQAEGVEPDGAEDAPCPAWSGSGRPGHRRCSCARGPGGPAPRGTGTCTGRRSAPGGRRCRPRRCPRRPSGAATSAPPRRRRRPVPCPPGYATAPDALPESAPTRAAGSLVGPGRDARQTAAVPAGRRSGAPATASVDPTTGGVAQLVERLTGSQEVRGFKSHRLHPNAEAAKHVPRSARRQHSELLPGMLPRGCFSCRRPPAPRRTAPPLTPPLLPGGLTPRGAHRRPW